MKRIALIATVIVLLVYGLWALTHPNRDIQTSAPAASRPPTVTTSTPATGEPPSSAASTPYTPATPGQPLDGDSDADMTMPPVSATPSPSVYPADPSQAAPISTVTPAAALPRTLTAAHPDWSKPDAVAQWFAQRYYTVDTAIDPHPAMGPARAAEAATTELAHTLRTTPDNDRPGAQWQGLVEGHGWVQASSRVVSMANAPTDTSSVAYRSVQVVEDRHSEGSFGTSTHLLALQLTRVSGQWRVSLVQEV